jgi:uncharacterized protein with GYD domain
MPLYISLMKMTDQGIRDVKNAPQRVALAAQAMEAMGGKLVSFYLVMGEYDYVALAEAPNDETALTFTLGLGAAGNVRTTTMKAFSKEEFTAMVKKLP